MQVLDTLQEIQERHDNVKEIEKKLLEQQQVMTKWMRNLIEMEINLNLGLQFTWYPPNADFPRPVAIG